MSNPILEILDTCAKTKRLSTQAKDVWKRKAKGLCFAVFGYRGTGKTTILNVMRGRVPNLDEAATLPGGQKVKDFMATLVDEKDYETLSKRRVKIKNITDLAGDPGAWSDWAEYFLKKQPKGILFVMDHNDIELQKAALKFLIEIMAHRRDWFGKIMHGPSKNEKALKHLCIFWILLNKRDIWEKEGKDKIFFLQQFNQEIKQLNQIFGNKKVVFEIKTCSALTDTEGLRLIAAQFYSEMLG